MFRADRTSAASKKTGGGLCIYVNNTWCTYAVTTDRLCTPDLEYIMVRCRPFQLPSDSYVVFANAVYIPLHTNAKLALELLHSAISKQQNSHPESSLYM